MFIPTAISPREVRALQRAARGAQAIDIGSLLGFSTIKLSEVASHVISIDKHEGYSNGPTLPVLRSNVACYARSSVEVIQADARLATGLVGEVAFVDLTGDRELTGSVIRRLSVRVGTVLIHDSGRVYCAGVNAAIRDLQNAWYPVAHTDTLVELKRIK